MKAREELHSLFPNISDNSSLVSLLNNINDGACILNEEQKILFWSRGAELITGFKREEVIGKNCSDNILAPVTAVGTKLCPEICPAKKTLSDGKIRSCDSYIHHQEGFRLPVCLRFIPISISKKTNGVFIVIIDTSPKVLLPQRTIELEHLSLLDQLTGTGNRRYLEINILSRLDELRRYRLPFGLLYIDVDNLADVNQAYGFKTGNNILRTIAQTLLNNSRFFDAVGRWEEDEFIVTILNISQSKLDMVANKLRLLVSQSSVFFEEKVIFATSSLGATLAKPNDNIDSLIERGKALKNYSKKLGRNCVSLTLDKDYTNK